MLWVGLESTYGRCNNAHGARVAVLAPANTALRPQLYHTLRRLPCGSNALPDPAFALAFRVCLQICLSVAHPLLKLYNQRRLFTPLLLHNGCHHSLPHRAAGPPQRGGKVRVCALRLHRPLPGTAAGAGARPSAMPGGAALPAARHRSAITGLRTSAEALGRRACGQVLQRARWLLERVAGHAGGQGAQERGCEGYL